jgi:flagellar protein FlaF
MSYDKYQTTQSLIGSSRQVEYRLFADVTKALMEVLAEPIRDKSFYEAIDRNRRLWLVLQMDLSSAENKLPDDVKAQLISLSIWVDRECRQILRDDGDVQALINVNRSIMEGLATKPSPEQNTTDT